MLVNTLTNVNKWHLIVKCYRFFFWRFTFILFCIGNRQCVPCVMATAKALTRHFIYAEPKHIIYHSFGASQALVFPSGNVHLYEAHLQLCTTYIVYYLSMFTSRNKAKRGRVFSFYKSHLFAWEAKQWDVSLEPWAPSLCCQGVLGQFAEFEGVPGGMTIVGIT